MRKAIANNRKASGICLLILAAIFGLSALDSVPTRDSLLAIDGVVEQVIPATPGKYGSPPRFRLRGNDRLFQYISKSGEMGPIDELLRRSTGKPARVRVEADDKFATVLELEVDGRVVRSYEEISAAWRSDNRFGNWVAGLSALAGIVVLTWGSRRTRG